MFGKEPLSSVRKRELQNLAEKHGLKDNESSASIAQKLLAVFEKEEESKTKEAEDKNKEREERKEGVISNETKKDNGQSQFAAVANSNETNCPMTPLPREPVLSGNRRTMSVTKEEQSIQSQNQMQLNKEKTDSIEKVETTTVVRENTRSSPSAAAVAPYEEKSLLDNACVQQDDEVTKKDEKARVDSTIETAETVESASGTCEETEPIVLKKGRRASWFIHLPSPTRSPATDNKMREKSAQTNSSNNRDTATKNISNAPNFLTKDSKTNRQAIVDELTRIMNDLESQHAVCDWQHKPETKPTCNDINTVGASPTTKSVNWEIVDSKLFDKQLFIGELQAAKDQPMQNLLTPTKQVTKSLGQGQEHKEEPEQEKGREEEEEEPEQEQEQACDEVIPLTKEYSLDHQKAHSNKGKALYRDDTPMMRKSQNKNSSKPCNVHLGCIEEEKENQPFKLMSPVPRNYDRTDNTQKSVHSCHKNCSKSEEYKNTATIIKSKLFDYSNIKPKVDSGLRKIPGRTLKSPLQPSTSTNISNQSKKAAKRNLISVNLDEANVCGSPRKRRRVANQK